MKKIVVFIAVVSVIALIILGANIPNIIDNYNFNDGYCRKCGNGFNKEVEEHKNGEIVTKYNCGDCGVHGSVVTYKWGKKDG